MAMDIDFLTLPEVREIYRTRMKHDFPGNELKELAMIEKVFREGRYLCYGAREGNDILAYAFFVLAEELYMLDYFAVKKERRGSGIGSRFLKELNSRCFREAACVLVEVDDPSFAENGKDRYEFQLYKASPNMTIENLDACVEFDISSNT